MYKGQRLPMMSKCCASCLGVPSICVAPRPWVRRTQKQKTFRLLLLFGTDRNHAVAHNNEALASKVVAANLAKILSFLTGSPNVC